MHEHPKPQRAPLFVDVNDAIRRARQLAAQTGRRHRVWFDPTTRQWKITRTNARIDRRS